MDSNFHSDLSESAIATRDERIARREADVRYQIRRSIKDITAISVLMITSAGALSVFYRHEVARNFLGDLIVAFSFVIAIAAVAYLNPQVQQLVRFRGKQREDVRDREYWIRRNEREKYDLPHSEHYTEPTPGSRQTDSPKGQK